MKKKSNCCAMLRAATFIQMMAIAGSIFAVNDAEGIQMGPATEKAQAEQQMSAYAKLQLAANGYAAKDGENAQDTVYMEPDVEPQFPGGTQNLINYLAQNLKYPEAAKAAKKEGRAIVKFVIDADGSVSDVEIFRSTGHEALDAEAVRVVKSLPKWTPGMKDGKPVRVRFNIPMTFSLQGQKEQSPKRYY